MLGGGYRAIDALRIEKGYRVWSSDITPEDNPYEAGLGFTVKLDTDRPFVGRDALRAVKEAGPTRRLRCLALDDSLAVTLGSEPVRIPDTAAGHTVTGRVTSGGYGFRVGQSLAFAYLPAATAELGRRVEIEVFGEWTGATVVRDPVWDPRGDRIRA
jgi:4-methylaminobutanoate oxidase (formaldehyde-forming)